MSKYIQEGDLILVEVPEDAGFFDTFIIKNQRQNHSVLNYQKQMHSPYGFCENVDLPGHYELIGKASELKWSDWVSIVDKESDESESLNCWWYKDYTQFEIWTKDAVKSGLSLLKKHNLNSQTTIILKKKQ